MTKVTPTSSRKSDHIRINLEEDVRSGLTTGLERYRFIHQALPELDLDQVDLSDSILREKPGRPITDFLHDGRNRRSRSHQPPLAAAAQETGIAMGLGSQRAAH